MIPAIHNEEESPHSHPHSYTAVSWNIHKRPLLEEMKECRLHGSHSATGVCVYLYGLAREAGISNVRVHCSYLPDLQYSRDLRIYQTI